MMYAHANALDNEEVNTNLDGLIVALSALTAFLVLATPTGVSAVSSLAGTSHLALGRGLVFDVVDIGAALLISFSLTSLYRRLIVERQARIALEAFQRFVSPHVLDQLRRNPDLLNMQGHRREMSILFSDIVGYTALSNSLGEDEIVEFYDVI